MGWQGLVHSLMLDVKELASALHLCLLCIPYNTDRYYTENVVCWTNFITTSQRQLMKEIRY